MGRRPPQPPDLRNMPFEPRRGDRGSFCMWELRNMPRPAEKLCNGRFYTTPGARRAALALDRVHAAARSSRWHPSRAAAG